MGQLTLTTFDWVPEAPRGFVRDLRVRWALEEAGLPYVVKSVPFNDREVEHFAHQPFGQVPWLTDGEATIFESGAILLHLGELSEKLMPTDAQGRSDTIGWLFAALNSVEIASLPWSIVRSSSGLGDTPVRKNLIEFLAGRLQRMDTILGEREWLVGKFTVADILMADVLRVVHQLNGLEEHHACRDYVLRATARISFKKAYEDQLAHFAAAD